MVKIFSFNLPYEITKTLKFKILKLSVMRYNYRLLQNYAHPILISSPNLSTYVGKAIFDMPLMIQSHAESIKKILVDLPAN